jgi:hypothetical protein
MLAATVIAWVTPARAERGHDYLVLARSALDLPPRIHPDRPHFGFEHVGRLRAMMGTQISAYVGLDVDKEGLVLQIYAAYDHSAGRGIDFTRRYPREGGAGLRLAF